MDTDPHSPPQATTSTATSLDIPCRSSEESASEAPSGDIGELASQSLPVPAPEAWHRILPPVRFFFLILLNCCFVLFLVSVT